MLERERIIELPKTELIFIAYKLGNPGVVPQFLHFD